MKRKIVNSARTTLAAAVVAWTTAVPAAEKPTNGLASARNLPISAPVKILPTGDVSSEQPTENEPVTEQEPDLPTLPGGKLPQYQLGRRHRLPPSEAEIKNPNLRFILALPSQPVLVEARITIDGKPFRMSREERIRRILKAVAPASDPTEPGASAETPGGAAIERIRRYAAATGQTPSADEVRWLLTNWCDGPTLLMLDDNFQRFRAGQRPAFDVLDRDRDGTISTDELDRAAESFKVCDLNGNDIVEATEIAKVADDPRLPQSEKDAGGKLIFPIPDAAAATYKQLAAVYSQRSQKGDADGVPAVLPRFDRDADGALDGDELRSLRDDPPDVTLTVAFNTAAAEKSTLAVTAVNSARESVPAGTARRVVASLRETYSVRGSTITLSLAGTALEFSAVQGGASDQVSVGAVNDGYPLLPAIDPNDDGRFTIRELRKLASNLRRFDRNRDGRLTDEETRAPIRVCFGLGPMVHRELAELRSVNRPPETPPVTGPDWFVRMDRNKDNDLSRGEFPGTDAQFEALDADDDELISAQEAVDATPKAHGPRPRGLKGPPARDSAPAESESSTAPSEKPE